MITQDMIIALGTVLTVVGFLIVTLRIYGKRKRTQSLKLSDYLIIASTACFCGTAAMILYGTFTQGYGQKSPPAVTQDGNNANQSNELSVTRHLTWSFICISTWTYGLAKLSVLFFYREIFRGKVFNVLSICTIIVVCLWTVTTFLVLFLQCGSHFEATWTNAAYVAKHCLSGFADGTAAAVLDVFTDLLIIMIPVYWVFKLQMPLKKRLSVIGVFLFGALTILSSIARLIALSLVYPTHNKNPDQYAYMTTLIYFGQLEAGLCIIAASLPTLGPFLFPTRKESSSSWKPIYKSPSEPHSRKWFGASQPATVTSVGAATSTEMTSFELRKHNDLLPYPVAARKGHDSFGDLSMLGESDILVTRSFDVESA